MTLAEGIAKLKVLLSKEQVEPIVTTEQSFKDVKLNDGLTIVRYDAEVLAVGVIVSLIDEAGQVLPLPIGDYVLEDGTTFSVVDDLGTIDNVVLVEEAAPEEEAKEEVAAKETPATAASPKAPEATPKRVIKSQVEEHVFNAFKDEVTATIGTLTATVGKLEAENIELKKQIEANKEVSKEMFSVVSQIAKQPASQPTEPTKEKFSVSKQRQTFKESLKELETKMTIENSK